VINADVYAHQNNQFHSWTIHWWPPCDWLMDLCNGNIVVLENIYRHLEKGEDSRTASVTGRNEIGFAAVSITLVDVVVFVPLALVTGLVGNIMREFALVVVFSTLMSLFVSFTVTPMLASRFAKLERLTKNSLPGRFGVWFEEKFKNLTDEYIKILKWGLVHRGKVALLTMGLLLASFALVPFGFIGSEIAHDNIGLLCQSASSFQTIRVVEIADNALLAAIPHRPCRNCAHGVARGRLNLCDFGSIVGQDHCGQTAR